MERFTMPSLSCGLGQIFRKRASKKVISEPSNLVQNPVTQDQLLSKIQWKSSDEFSRTIKGFSPKERAIFEQYMIKNSLGDKEVASFASLTDEKITELVEKLRMKLGKLDFDFDENSKRKRFRTSKGKVFDPFASIPESHSDWHYTNPQGKWGREPLNIEQEGEEVINILRKRTQDAVDAEIQKRNKPTE
jgi:hypothetical protein